MPHTAWSRQLADFRINGRSGGEIGLESCFAGHWNIPFALAHGDAAVCAEAREQFPRIVTAEVERAIGRDQRVALEPETARQLPAEEIAEAIELTRAGKISPFKPRMPMTVTVEMRTIELAETLAQRPGVRLIPPLTVEIDLDQPCDVVTWFKGAGLNMESAGR